MKYYSYMVLVAALCLASASYALPGATSASVLDRDSEITFDIGESVSLDSHGVFGIQLRLGYLYRVNHWMQLGIYPSLSLYRLHGDHYDVGLSAGPTFNFSDTLENSVYVTALLGPELKHNEIGLRASLELGKRFRLFKSTTFRPYVGVQTTKGLGVSFIGAPFSFSTNF